jgi:flagellar basal body-associated protein FliL
MRPYRLCPAPSSRSRSGAALLLSLLILLVLVAIVIQIKMTTSTDARVARNDVGLTTMDLAVESAILQVEDQLKTDAGSATDPSSAGAAGAVPGAAAPAAPADPAGAAGAGGQQAATDSRKDEWARPQRTSINDIRLRALVQDEDSKLNVLNMLNPDEKEAQAAFDRVVRCLDLCREGTRADIDARTAEEMARAMLEYMTQRRNSKVPRAELLSDDPQAEDQGMPRSLKEFSLLPPFDESHFRDFRDEDGLIVHSIGSFLTVWSSIATVGELQKSGGNGAASAAAAGGAAAAAGTGGAAGGAGGAQTGGGKSGSGGAQAGGGSGGQSGGSGGAAGGAGAGGGNAAGGAAGAAGAGGSTRLEAGGYAVNVNTAPVAVLKSLFDDRDLPPRFWDRLIEYRNLEEEKEPEEATTEEVEPALDEFGEEILDRRIFDNLAELSEVDGYQELSAEIQGRLSQLLTVESRVFSIFVIARRSTGVEGDMTDSYASREEFEASEQSGDSLLRVVRCVVWRHKQDDEIEIVPLVRWEVLDYVPYEVLDYPDEDR